MGKGYLLLLAGLIVGALGAIANLDFLALAGAAACAFGVTLIGAVLVLRTARDWNRWS